MNGEGRSTPLTALLLAFLGYEVTLARPLGRVDVVFTTETHDLFTGTLRRRFGVPAGLMRTDKVASAFFADPLASDGVLLEAVQVGLDRFDVVGGGQGDKGGEVRRGEAGGVWSGSVPKAQVRQVVQRATFRISGGD